MSRTIEGFRGERPIVAPGLLQDNEATDTLDVRIEGGKVYSMNDNLHVRPKTTGAALKSIYPYGGNWFEWEGDVDATETQIGADAYNRVIFTGDGAPKVTYTALATTGAQPFPSSSYLLGTPPPGYISGSFDFGQAITGNVTGTPDDIDDLVDTRFYVATSVDIFGAEGPPCLVSSAFEWQPGQTVNLTIPAEASGNYNITGWRLYRTSTGSSSTEFQYVKDGTGTATTDSTGADDLVEVLTTEDYNLPHPSMIGITAMPGAYLAGFYDNILFFSEPGYPHAWPIGYQLNTKTPIVGIKVISQNTILVTTTEKPYIAVGTDPANMSLSSLDDILEANASKRSMADVGPGVVFASPDGLIMVGTSGTRNLTEQIFSRAQWQAMDPTSMQCFYHESTCLVTWENLTASTQGTFAINPSAPEGGIVRISGHIDGGHYAGETDLLYLSKDGNIEVYDEGTTWRDGMWRSKLFEHKSPSTFSAARIWGEFLGTVRLTLGTGVREFFSRIMPDSRPHRLQGGQKRAAINVKLNLTDGQTIHRVELAESMSELRGG